MHTFDEVEPIPLESLELALPEGDEGDFSDVFEDSSNSDVTPTGQPFSIGFHQQVQPLAIGIGNNNSSYNIGNGAYRPMAMANAQSYLGNFGLVSAALQSPMLTGLGLTSMHSGLGFTPQASQNVPWVSNESLMGMRQRPPIDLGLAFAPNATFPMPNASNNAAAAAPKRALDNATLPVQEGNELKPAPKRRKTSKSSACRQTDQWSRRLEELRVFQQRFGNTLVPHNWTENPPLAQWVKRQRYQFKLMREGKRSNLSEGRKLRLDELGFVWDSHAVAWEDKFKALLQFKGREGHCNVPITYARDPQLAIWVKCQRRQYKLCQEQKTKSTMTPERVARLERVGFVWFPRQES